MRVNVESLWFRYGTAAPVLTGISTGDIEPGFVTALIGPNAAGKSTLLKCVAGMLRGVGSITLDGVSADRFDRGGGRARVVSYLPQEYPSTAALTVFEAVLLARQHTSSWLVNDQDLDHVEGVLSELRLAPLALRYLNELSGGQRQMVAVAQALAREPRVLLLDEPTSSLDLQRQLELLTLVRRVARQRAMTVVIAVHDLNLAARFADRLLVLRQGTLVAAGEPAEVLSSALLRSVYGIEARITLDCDHIPLITPIRAISDHEGNNLYDSRIDESRGGEGDRAPALGATRRDV
jgi:iron complex transport system ATP-binding protein